MLARKLRSLSATMRTARRHTAMRQRARRRWRRAILALTLPNEPNEFDDGLLTANEVAQLSRWRIFIDRARKPRYTLSEG
jgi:hypothetical protein